MSLLRALAAILTAHTDDTPPPALAVDLPPVNEPKPDTDSTVQTTAAPSKPEPKRAPEVVLDPCISCGIAPKLGSDFCGDFCQARWTAAANAVIPLEATPPTLPDGSTYRGTP